MQTFLPYPSIHQSATVLDYRRLGKQRVEGYQILNILLGKSKKTKTGKVAWANHPAVKMWSGYEKFLCLYVSIMCKEWIRRGYKDTLLPKILGYMNELNNVQILAPDFIGNEEFHRSHQSNLIRKDATYYGKHFKNVPDNLEYVWPSKEVINGR